MINEHTLRKPKNVIYAVQTLWAWTAWVFFVSGGVALIRIPEIKKSMGDQLADMNGQLSGISDVMPEAADMLSGMTVQMQKILAIDTLTLAALTIVRYGLEAAVALWFITKIGAGKNWARSSLLWCCLLEAAWIACSPLEGFADYLTDIPDLAFQAGAIYLLYTRPGRDWFLAKKR
ncbi:MAG: hypothetical protein WCD70_06630 [Alphaproteobacteria bacterium]